MQALSEDVKDMLVSNSELGLIFARTLFIAKEPAAPNNCVTLFDTGGFQDIITMDKNIVELPSLNIRIRNISYEDGIILANQIKDYLYTQIQEIWNDTLYTSIVCVNGPFLLDWDDKGNARIVMNYNFQRR